MLQTLRAVENLFRGLGEPSIQTDQVDDAVLKIRSMSKDTVSPYSLIISQDAVAAEDEKKSRATQMQRKRKRDKEVWVTLKSRKHSNTVPKKSYEAKAVNANKMPNKVDPDEGDKTSADQKSGTHFAPLDLLLESGDRSGPC